MAQTLHSLLKYLDISFLAVGLPVALPVPLLVLLLVLVLVCVSLFSLFVCDMLDRKRLPEGSRSNR